MPNRKILEHKNDEDKLVYRINPNSKLGKYYIVASDSRRENILLNPIVLEGFDALPSGFYKDGYGLTAATNFVLDEI